MQFLNQQPLLSKYHLSPKKGEPRSEREELIENFRARLNEARLGTKYRPLSHVAVKMKLQHMEKDHEVFAFYRECESARSFSAFFFFALNPARHENS